MRSKSGFLFALWVVFITLFLFGITIVRYGIEQDNAESSLVSPSRVLELRDELDLFEMRERALVLSSWKEAGGDSDVFMDGFYDGVSRESEMVNFLTDIVLIGDVEIGREGVNFDRAFFDRVYGVEKDGENFILKRGMVRKEADLRAEGGAEKIYFDVGFGFEFEKGYVLNEDGVVE